MVTLNRHLSILQEARTNLPTYSINSKSWHTLSFMKNECWTQKDVEGHVGEASRANVMGAASGRKTHVQVALEETAPSLLRLSLKP